MVNGSVPLRVAAVMDTWNVSGPGRQLAALSNSLTPFDVELRPFLFHRVNRKKAPFFQYLEESRVEYTAIEETRAIDPQALISMVRALRDWRPDIVQTHHYKATTYFALSRLFAAKVPWIAFFHGDTLENSKMRLYNFLHAKELAFADRLVVLSEEHRRRFDHLADRIRLIHNAVLDLPDQGERVDLSALRALGFPIIGVLARLSFEKGVDLALEAVARMRQEKRHLLLVIAGEGPERKRLERQAYELGIVEQVFFLGFVDNVGSLYDQIDALVIPSREGAEGMPNVLLEALNRDVPVVSSSVAAVPEVLNGDLDGASAIFEPNDIGALTKGLTEVLMQGRQSGASAVRKRLIAPFSLKARTEAHLAVYHELVARF